jgi:hypothetical protein
MRERISTAELIGITGASARDIDNWLWRLPLATKYDQKGRGRARGFSRDNALEIALVAALVKLRIQASDAASQMEVLFSNWQDCKPKELEWTIFFWGGSPLHSISDDKPPFKNKDLMVALSDLTEEGETFTILHTGNIIRRVDNLFKTNPARSELRSKVA